MSVSFHFVACQEKYEYVHLASAENSSCGPVQEMFLQPAATEVKNEPKMDGCKEVSHIMVEEALCEELPQLPYEPLCAYLSKEASSPTIPPQYIADWPDLRYVNPQGTKGSDFV